jgi:hypothetical protein
MSADLQPDELEVLQAEPPIGPQPAVHVIVDGPVRTQDLPRKQGATRSRVIGTTPQKYFAADHRRASVRGVSIGQNVLIAHNAASAADPSTMALWPVNTPFLITSDSEIWFASASGTTTISTITEYWATGE